MIKEKIDHEFSKLQLKYLLKCWAFGITGFIIIVLIENFWLFAIFLPIYILYILNIKELKEMKKLMPIKKGE